MVFNLLNHTATIYEQRTTEPVWVCNDTGKVEAWGTNFTYSTVQRLEDIPLLKNLSWLRLPTMINAPLAPSLPLTFCAGLHCSRHCFSTTSNAGLIAWLITSPVRRLSTPLCNSITQRCCLAKCLGSRNRQRQESVIARTICESKDRLSCSSRIFQGIRHVRWRVGTSHRTVYNICPRFPEGSGTVSTV